LAGGYLHRRARMAAFGSASLIFMALTAAWQAKPMASAQAAEEHSKEGRAEITYACVRMIADPSRRPRPRFVIVGQGTLSVCHCFGRGRDGSNRRRPARGSRSRAMDHGRVAHAVAGIMRADRDAAGFAASRPCMRRSARSGRTGRSCPNQSMILRPPSRSEQPSHRGLSGGSTPSAAPLALSHRQWPMPKLDGPAYR
jgi:hypothetical protein